MKKRMQVLLPGVIAALSITGCEITGPNLDDLNIPRPPLDNYVAVGTSVSMGWMSEGVLFSSQEQAWTKQLATAAGVTFNLPLIASFGCKPPLKAPLITFKRLDESSVGTPSTVCAANLPGITLPTNSLAVEGATASHALNSTPESAPDDKKPVTSRVLRSGQTQITAMRALRPTFVSVELGGNEVLPAQAGILIPNVTYTPFATFQESYGKVIDSVKATAARAVLVSLPTDIRKFPTIRTGAEIASQRAVFGAYHVTVNADCDASTNLVFVRGAVLTAIATGAGRKAAGATPFDFTCADQPGKQDFILTPADVDFINNLLSQMNAEITAKANANGYALFSLEALYATSKDGIPFNLQTFLNSPTPYGERISLDGIHPSGAGHRVLAIAAIAAINARYNFGIPAIGN